MSRKVYLFLIAIIAVAGVYTAFFMMTFNIKKSAVSVESAELTSGFDVTVGSKTYENVNLRELSFDQVPANTLITYSIILPDSGYNNPMLTIYMAHSKTNVYVGDELVYSFGQESNKMWGYGYVHFPIPENYGGKLLKVEQLVMEKGEVSAIDIPVITADSEYFYRNLAVRYRLQLFIDCTLILLGLVVGSVAFIFMIKNPEMLKLVFLAMSFFGMGTWVFCNYKLISIFTNDLTLKGYIEYLSFYIAPFFFTLYFEDDYYKREETPRRYIYLGILVAQGLFAVISVIMHIIDARHLPKSLPISHVLLILSLSFILYMSLRALRLKKHMHKPFLIGFFLLILFSLRDMILFINYYYVGQSKGNKYESRILSGILMFAIAMIIDFFSVQTRRMAAEARNEALNKMAYTDTMTGLYNRRKCVEEFGNLGSSHDKTEFAMVSFDLNDLKKTNDNYGHSAGDELLTDFSNLLTSVFSENCVVCRMGGDEFLAIIKDINKADPGKLMELLKEKQDEMNKNRKPLPLSFAYGLCTTLDDKVKDVSREDGPTLVMEVYKQSDERMYECKAAMKAERAKRLTGSIG